MHTGLLRQSVSAPGIALSRPAALTAESATEIIDPIIGRFLDAVWMERGLSPNTLAAYRADLAALSRWLAQRNLVLARTGRADVLAFIAARAAGGSRPRSTARQLSSFRRFFRYLVREGVVHEDPTAQIAMPRIGRSLPKSLTEAEVESLLLAPPGERSARQPRSHHARSAVRHGLARLGAGEPASRSGEPDPGRAARAGQGQPRAPDPARRGSGALARRVSGRTARRDTAATAAPTTCFRHAAATA